MTKQPKHRRSPREPSSRSMEISALIGFWLVAGIFDLMVTLEAVDSLGTGGHLHYRPPLVLLAACTTILSLIQTFRCWRLRRHNRDN